MLASRNSRPPATGAGAACVSAARCVAIVLVLVSALVALSNAQTVVSIRNCTEGARYRVVSGGSYYLINCTARNVTLFSDLATTELLNVAILIEGGRAFPRFRFPQEATGGSGNPTFNMDRMFNVSIRLDNVAAEAPAGNTPIWLAAIDLSCISVVMHRLRLGASVGTLVFYQSTSRGQWLSVNVTDSQIHSNPSFDDTSIFLFDVLKAEFIAVAILRSDFMLRVQNRSDVLTFEKSTTLLNARIHLADTTVSSLIVQSARRDSYVTALRLSPFNSSTNVSCFVERVTVDVAADDGVVVGHAFDSFVVTATGSLQDYHVVCEAVSMHVRAGSAASIVMMKDVGISRGVTVALLGCTVSFLLDGRFSTTASSSGRTGNLVRVSEGRTVADLSISVTIAHLEALLTRSPTAELESYSFARSSIVFVATIPTMRNVTIRVANTSMAVVVNDQVKGVIQQIVGTRGFQATASLVLIQLCDVTASRFVVEDCVLLANVTVGAPPALPAAVKDLMSSWSAVVAALIVANATASSAAVRNTLVHTLHMDVGRGEAVPAVGGDGADPCAGPLVMNLTALLLALDLVPQLVACVDPILMTMVPPELVPAPMRHADFNATIENATIRMSDASLQAGAAVALYNPPSFTNRVQIVASGVFLLPYYQPQEDPSDAPHTVVTQLSGLVYVYLGTINRLTMILRDVHGWQAVLYRRVLLTATMDDAVFHVTNSSFVAWARSPWALSLPLASLANVSIHVDASAFTGFAGLLQENRTSLPSWNVAHPSYLALGCNRWDGDATTRRFCNRAVFANLHPIRSGLVADTTAACYEAPTQTIPVIEPARSRAIRVSDAAASASTVAIAISGASSLLLPSVASGLSAVRLQTSMRLLRNQQRCAAREGNSISSSTSSGSSGDDDDAYGSFAIDNPTLAALPGLGPSRAFAGGAVLSNCALVVCVAVASSVLPRLWVRWHAKNDEILAGGHRAWFSNALLDRVPGSGAALYSILLQPVVGCSLVLLALGGPARVGGALLGAVGLLFAIAPIVLTSVRVFRGGFPLVARPMRPRRSTAARKKGPGRSSVSESCHPSLSRFATTVTAVAQPKWEWRAPPRAGGTDGARGLQVRLRCRALLKRYGAFFDCYRIYWYFLVDLCATLVLGVLDALPIVIDDACVVTLYGVLAITCLALVLVCMVRPCTAPLDNILAIVGTGLTAVTTAVIVLAAGEGGNDIAVEVLVLVQSALTIVGQLWALGAFVVQLARGGLSKWLSSTSFPPIQNLFSRDSLLAALPQHRHPAHHRGTSARRLRSLQPPPRPTEAALDVPGGGAASSPAPSREQQLSALLEFICAQAKGEV